jgi:hypothetical protein
VLRSASTGSPWTEFIHGSSPQRTPRCASGPALRIIAVSFFALAAYVTVDAVRVLVGAAEPEDVVFLRNVLIYFDLATRRDILARLRRVLRPDGVLFLGGAETTLGVDNHFERVQVGAVSCYRLSAEGTAP